MIFFSSNFHSCSKKTFRKMKTSEFKFRKKWSPKTSFCRKRYGRLEGSVNRVLNWVLRRLALCNSSINFSSRVFPQIRPVWTGDLGTREENSWWFRLENCRFVLFSAVGDSNLKITFKIEKPLLNRVKIKKIAKNLPRPVEVYI